MDKCSSEENNPFYSQEKEMTKLDLGGDLYKEAFEIYRTLSGVVPPDWIHREQILKASSSIATNIAEGTGKRLLNYRYYPVYLLTSRGSAFETLAWIEIGVLDGVFNQSLLDSLDSKISTLSDRLKQTIIPEES